MTGIVEKSLENNRLSIIDFYLARARRIIPALACLCLILLAGGYFVLQSQDYKTLSTHAISSTAFFSNFKYWNEAGYFDAASHEKWLLHTWSLSVEWQFYMIFPVVLWCVWKLKPGRRTQIGAIFIGFVTSFSTSIVLSKSDPNTAFYLLHTRAWEMLAGGIVLFLSRTSLQFLAHKWRVDILGLAILIIATLTFDTHTVWPGWKAMFPVLGAMLILSANRVSILTGSGLAQWLGDRSYSLYLWHWPLVVALTFAEMQQKPVAIACAILMTIAISHASYAWVEKPARQHLELLGRRSSISAFATVACIVCGVSFAIRATDGIDGRFPRNIEIAAAEAQNRNNHRGDCEHPIGPKSAYCLFGGKSAAVIGVGDSHVTAEISALVEALPASSLGAIEFSHHSCSFISGVHSTPEHLASFGTCPYFLEWTRLRLEEFPKSTPVVIINKYPPMQLTQARGAEPYVPIFYFSKIYPAPTQEYFDEFATHIRETACNLSRNHPVYLVRPIPDMPVNVPKTLSRRLSLGLGEDITVSEIEYREKYKWVWTAQDAARDQCGVKILDPTPYLCQGGRCYGSKNGRPLFYDSHHLSEYGNKLLVPMFRSIFSN